MNINTLIITLVILNQSNSFDVKDFFAFQNFDGFFQDYLQNHPDICDNIEDCKFREQVLRERIRHIELDNDQNDGWREGINDFSYMTREERNSHLGLLGNEERKLAYVTNPLRLL